MIVYSHHHGSACGAECRPGETQDHAQGRVEDGASCGIVDGGADTLHEVAGGVERYEFEEQFGYDGRDGRGPGSRFGEWLVRDNN
jgi:hypothetical protein